VEIELEERAGTKLSVTTEPLSADFALSELGSVPSERHLTDPDRKLRLERLPKSGPPLGWSGELIDPEAPAGVHPYWVRVAQDDTGMAWLSPIHVTVRPRAGQ